MGGLKLASPPLFKGSSFVSGLSAFVFVMAFATGCGSGTSAAPVVPAPNPNTTWVPVGNTGMTGNVYIISSPNGNLFAASNSGGGFARSSDHGMTWSPFNNGSPSTCHWGMGISDQGELISGSLSNMSVAGCFNITPYMLVLPGNSNTWTVAPIPQPPAPQMAFLISVGVAKGNVIAAGSGGLYY